MFCALFSALAAVRLAPMGAPRGGAVLAAVRPLAPRHAPATMGVQRDSAAAQRQRRAVQLSFLRNAGLPAEVDALLEPTVDRRAATANWRQFAACYASEAEAIRAAKRNELPLLPFMVEADGIGFCYQILNDKFELAEVQEIIAKNPGVLGNQPGQLAKSSAGEIRAGASLVTYFDALPPQLLAVVPTITAVAVVAGVANRLRECAGTCG